MSMLPKTFYLDSIFDDFMDSNIAHDMKCDIYEKGGLCHIEADIPGIDKKDISVEYSDDYLTISAEKKSEEENHEKNFIKKERFYGKMQRKFYVGNIDEKEIKAEFKDGVLKITIPKENKEKEKKLIDIE